MPELDGPVHHLCPRRYKEAAAVKHWPEDAPPHVALTATDLISGDGLLHLPGSVDTVQLELDRIDVVLMVHHDCLRRPCGIDCVKRDEAVGPGV